MPRLRRSSEIFGNVTGGHWECIHKWISCHIPYYTPAIILQLYHIIPQLYIYDIHIFINGLAPLAWTPCWQPQPPLLRLSGEQNHVGTWSVWAHNRQGPEEEYSCKLYLSVNIYIYIYIGAYNHRRSIMYISLFTQFHIFQNVYQKKSSITN